MSKIKNVIDWFPSFSIILRAKFTQSQSEPDAYYFFNEFIPKLNVRFIGYDFGANFGVYSYYMTKYCKVVHSVEPNPFAFVFLKRWTKKYDQIKIYENAVSEQKTNIELITPVINGIYRHRLSSTEVSFIESKADKITNKLISIVEPLDLRDIGFSSENQNTLFKCDIEGGEVNIKCTLRSALERKSIGMIEASPRNTKNFHEFILSFRDIADIYVIEDKKFIPISESNLKNFQNCHFNYFFVSRKLSNENAVISESLKS